MKTITCHCGNKVIIMDHGLAYISKAMNAAPMVIIDAWKKP